MNFISEFIEVIFSMALFVNAILFIPQSIEIYRKKSSNGVSLLTFLGFLLIQLFIVLHAIIKHDYILLIGYLLSMITCGSVVALILRFKNKALPSDIDIINQLPGHVYWKDTQGRMLGCNQSNMNDFGIDDINDYIGKTDYDLFNKEEADKIRLVDDEVVRNKVTKIFEESSTVASGEKVIFLSYKAPLKNHKGDVIGVIGYSMPVDDIKNKHQDRVDMLENIIAEMPGKVYWMNRQGIYLGCNNNEAEAIGLRSRYDIVGKRNKDLPGFLIPEELDPVNEKIMSDGKAITLEEPAKHKDGTDAIYLSSKVPLINKKNQVIGLLGISIDITDMKQKEKELQEAKEKAEESSIAKNDFIKNIEHDLRTPFSGVLGLAQCLLVEEQDKDKREVIKQIASCAEDLLDYHNKVLDFSNVKTGSIPISLKKFDLRNIVENIVHIEKPAATNKGVKLIYRYDDSIPSILMGDDYRVKRILINLVSNAIKFTAEGSIEISVQKAIQNNEHIIVEFIIKDTGIGIPVDKQQFIFEEFTRLNPSNKGAYKGVGIGLKIVKDFVKDVSGNIDLHSEMGKGSIFTITVPFIKPLTQNIYDMECNNE